MKRRRRQGRASRVRKGREAGGGEAGQAAAKPETWKIGRRERPGFSSPLSLSRMFLLFRRVRKEAGRFTEDFFLMQTCTRRIFARAGEMVGEKREQSRAAPSKTRRKSVQVFLVVSLLQFKSPGP